MTRSKNKSMGWSTGWFVVGSILGVLINGLVLGLPTFADDPPLSKPAAIKIEEIDALKIQSQYQITLRAQTEFENTLLKTKIKYKIPLDWSFNLDTGIFEPPQPQPQQLPKPSQPATKPEEKKDGRPN